MIPKTRATLIDCAVLALGLAIFAAQVWHHRNFIHDDTFITLRYAVNYAETGLPQWNPGEWVEGYTSFLHLSALSGLIRLGLEPVAAAQGLNLAAAVVLLVLLAIAARQVVPAPEDAALRAMAVLAVAATPAFAIWALGGLEAVPLAAVLALGLLALIRWWNRQAAGDAPGPGLPALAALAFSAAVLIRLDASVFVAGAGLGLVLATHGITLTRRAGLLFLIVGVPALVAFVQMGIRLSVYDAPFPMTFYAKAGLPILRRIAGGFPYLVLSTALVQVVAAALLAVAIAIYQRRLKGLALLIALPALLQGTYILWAGGDHMPWARMLVPLIVPAALLILALVRDLEPRTGLLVTGATFGVTLAFAITAPPQKMDPAAFYGGLVGRHIEAEWPQGITIGLNTAGSTPYYAREGRNYIDMLGLNDASIARREDVPLRTRGQRMPGHGKGDGAYVLSRAPERIIVGPATGIDVARAGHWFLTGLELSELEGFGRCYEKVVEWVHYDPALSSVGPKASNPLKLVYYQRTCDPVALSSTGRSD